MRNPVLLALVVLALVLCPSLLVAQTPDAEPDFGIPMVTFEMNWVDAGPHWYSVSIDALGRAAYQSEPDIHPGETPGVPYMVKFTATDATRDRVFELAEELHRFQNAKHYAKTNATEIGNVQTGIKTLRWQDAKHDFQAAYDSSADPKVMELTSLFQRISATMEEERRVGDKFYFDQGGLSAELQRMADMNKRHELLELQAFRPFLQSIEDDQALRDNVRQHALALLRVAEQDANE